MSSSPAVFEIVENFRMVAKIASQSTIITMSPASGDCSPKKAPDHRALRINGTPKMLQSILNIIALRILISIAIFIIVMFAVAWILEDIIYFSLFIGIPAGIISAAVVFVILTWYQNKKR